MWAAGSAATCGTSRATASVSTTTPSGRACRARGLEVFTPDEFRQTEHARPERFDSLLLAHVIEHLTEDDGARSSRSTSRSCSETAG